MAAASHQLAISKAYGLVKPAIPVMKTQVELTGFSEANRAVIQKLKIKLPASYIDQVEPVIDDQLTKAGVRLANLLNSIWP